jgi:hypothetical protein
MLGYPVFCKLDAMLTHTIHEHNGVYTVDLQAMSDFTLDQLNGRTEDIPEPFRKLDRKRVTLVGQMWSPTTSAGKLSRFVLVYSINNCCFSGPPLVQHFVHATISDAEPVALSGGFVKVTGMLHVGVERDAAGLTSVYRIDVEHLQRI